MTLRQYLILAREARYSLLLALPLLLLYEGFAALLSGGEMVGVRNGADVLLKTAFLALGGRRGLLVFNVLLLGAGAWLVWRNWRGQPGPLRPGVFTLMFAESLVYAALLGRTVSWLTALLLTGGRLAVPPLQTPVEALPLASQLVVSLGAGLYEEILFRVLLVSGLTLLGVKLGWRRGMAVGVAVVLSALIFSAFHYVGPYGDALTLPSFTFRAIAGLLLSGLYVARGFGITAWSHALYDVGLALLGS